MAIVRDNPQTAAKTTNANDQTLSYTVNSGSDRVLVVVGHFQRNADNNFSPSCTWAGNAMTQAVSQTTTFSTSRRWYTVIWYYINPSVTTADIVMAAGATVNSFAIAAVTLQGVHQTTPLGSFISDVTNPANSLALTGCSADSMIIAGVTSDSGDTPTWSWTTASEAHDVNNGNTNLELAHSDGYYANPSSGNVTLTATRNSAGQGQVGVAAEFLTSAGGGGAVKPMWYYEALMNE